MVNITIDDMRTQVPEGTSIMEAAAGAGIRIPKLCFLKDINEIGACRICVVEIEGMEQVVTSCNHSVEEGMVIRTNNPRIRKIRRSNLELILSEHNSNCPVCSRNGNCSLQDVTQKLGVTEVPFAVSFETGTTDPDFPIIRDNSRCIKCMRCVNLCDKVQTLGVWDVAGTGYRTTVGVAGGADIKDANCSACGQCVTHCPVGALSVRNDMEKVYDALGDPERITVLQVAPAVRAGFADLLQQEGRTLSPGQMVSALKQMGFDYVFDTSFAADLTIMEEGSELIERLGDAQEHDWPMFTSCCPGWVRFLKQEYPELTAHLSSAKSPQQMFGAVAKSYFADKIGVDPDRLCVISVMPCSAKKYECDVEALNATKGIKDVDVVITTREMIRMMRAADIDFPALPESFFDSPLGEGTGAAIIFGASGGVMESALRSAHYLITHKHITPDAFKEVRGYTGRRELSVDVGGRKLRCAALSSLAEARKLIEDIRSKKVHYDFVEVMACPGGCAGGGGQPIRDGQEQACDRAGLLYRIDRENPERFSYENREVQTLYREYLDKPLSEKAHHLLHTDQREWEL